MSVVERLIICYKSSRIFGVMAIVSNGCENTALTRVISEITKSYRASNSLAFQRYINFIWR